MRNGIVKASKSKSPIVPLPFSVGDVVAVRNGVGVDGGGIVIESNSQETFWREPDGTMESQSTDEVFLVASADSRPLAQAGQSVRCWVGGSECGGTIVEVTKMGAVVEPIEDETSKNDIDRMDYDYLFITHNRLLIVSKP